MTGTEPVFLTTSEVAGLLRIKERKVYELAASKRIPCKKITGKLLFPKDEIFDWLDSSHATKNLAAENIFNSVRHKHHANTHVPLVVLGSHDPLLEAALRESSCFLPTLFNSSMEGLESFDAARGSVVGLHIMENSGQGWNTELVESRYANTPVVLLEWSKRQRGILYRKQSAKKIVTEHSIAGLQMVARQAGAGSQKLFLELLENGRFGQQAGVETSHLSLTEQEAATAVLEGKGDFAFGLSCMAPRLGLEFIPVIQERFDLLLYRRVYFEASFQTFIRFCRSDAFASMAAELGGYDISNAFKVHYNGR